MTKEFDGYNLGLVVGTIEKLLFETFPNTKQKQYIIEHDNRIQFACPYCKDSETRMNEKRGNLYLDTLKYVCFNCETRCYFDEMLKVFELKIDIKEKVKLGKYLAQSKKAAQIGFGKKTEDFINEKFDKLINLNDLIDVLSSEKNINPLHDLKPLVKNSRAYIYLKNRKLSDAQLKNIYQGSYWLNEEKTRFEPVIVFLNRKNKSEEIIGIQTRNLESGYKRRFKIYNYESCYKLLHGLDVDKDDISIDHMNSATLSIYNKMSYIFNIFNISLYVPITVFEGYLDSLFFPNSIGMVGTSTDISFLEDNEIDLRFCYDNDDAGYKKAAQKIMKFPVFLWRKLIDQLVLMHPSKNKDITFIKVNSTIKDLNKLAEYFEKPYSKLELEKYFSKDKFDIKYIPKPKKKKYEKVPKQYKKFN